jgi:hypothetical protein
LHPVPWLESAEKTYLLFQPGHFQSAQCGILRLFDPFELHLEEVNLKLLVDLMMLKLSIHADVTMEAPIPIFVDSFIQGCIGH